VPTPCLLGIAALCADPTSLLRKAPHTHKVKSFAAAHSAHYQTGLTCISRAPCLSDFELLPLPSRPSFERRIGGEEGEEKEEEKDTTVPEEEEEEEEAAVSEPSERALVPAMPLPPGHGALTVEEHRQMQGALHGGESPRTAFTRAGGDEALQETCTDEGRSTLRDAAIGRLRLRQRSSMCLEEYAKQRRQHAEQAVQQAQVQQQAQRKQMARYQAERKQIRADAGTLSHSSLSLDKYLALTRAEYRQRQAPALALTGGDACVPVQSPLRSVLPRPARTTLLLIETDIETDTETDTTTLADNAEAGKLRRLSLSLDEVEPVCPEALFPAPHRSRSRSPQSLDSFLNTQYVPSRSPGKTTSRSPGKKRSPSCESCGASPVVLLLSLLELRPLTNTALFEPECAHTRGAGF
jgi:hypothetical protein